MKYVRVVMALGLLVGCGGLSTADASDPNTGGGPPPPKQPSARFVSCTAGPQVGTVSVEGSWADCTGVDSVSVTVVPFDAQGKQQLGKAAYLTSPPAILPTSQWTGKVVGLTTGHTVKAAGVYIYPAQPAGGGGVVSMASGISGQLNVVVP